MLKLKLQYSGHLMGRTDSLEKTLMLGKVEIRRRRGWQKMRWLDDITYPMDEFEQAPGVGESHVHWVGDAIPPSHPMSSPSPPTFNLSQRQGLFQGVSSSHQVAKILELQYQHQRFQWIFRTDFLWDWLVWSCSPKDSQQPSPIDATVKSIDSLALRLFIVQLSHLYMTSRKP